MGKLLISYSILRIVICVKNRRDKVIGKAKNILVLNVMLLCHISHCGDKPFKKQSKEACSSSSTS